jgi:hypothetical protein
LAAKILALSECTCDRAKAVVEADAARAQATAVYQADGRSIDPVLDAIDRQINQSAAFLGTLTEYNLAIADYVLAVLPQTITGEELVQGLVVSR